MQKPNELQPVQPGAVRAISVADFMTRDLVTVLETDDLALAESILRLNAISHLPVVRDQKLVGLLTHRELLRSAAEHAPKSTPAVEAMTPQPASVLASTSLVHAARIMLANKYGCLPVCEADGTLVGIITESDFVRFAADVVQDLDLVAEAVAAQSRA